MKGKWAFLLVHANPPAARQSNLIEHHKIGRKAFHHSQVLDGSQGTCTANVVVRALSKIQLTFFVSSWWYLASGFLKSNLGKLLT